MCYNIIMDESFIISRLAANRAVFEAMLRGVPEDLLRWRPRADHWCLLEIVCHLYDEEREDFRGRVRCVLEDPAKELPKIDPQGWVSSRKYMEEDYEAKLDAFLREREASIHWLEGLRAPKWENVYEHPKVGPMSARFLLANWLAHDYLHIRQITKVKYLYVQQESGEKVDYAGAW